MRTQLCRAQFTLAKLSWFFILIAFFVGWFDFSATIKAEEANDPLSMVVMDPLAAPLSCPCVEGYAQRKYEVFAQALGERLGREVTVTFAESLEKAMQQPTCSQIDIIVGKDSVVRADAAELKLGAIPVGQLTGKDGKTTQTGLIIVPTGDPAQTVADLANYRIVFGPPDCDEKFKAARNLLARSHVIVPAEEKTESSSACSDGATLILDLGAEARAAAVISSYAAPLLEGCGTVQKGALRVVGKTDPVPFVTLYFTENIPAEQREAYLAAFIQTSREPAILLALESLLGFVPLTAEYRQWNAEPGQQPSTPASTDNLPGDGDTSSLNLKPWPGWRGPNRDGHCDWLPQQLPVEADVLWQKQLKHEGLGGIAATEDRVIVGDRDFSNQLDEFLCFDARTGERLWTVTYPAPGRLDYDNSPRATPLVDDGLVYLFGAFGDLNCVDLNTGRILWRKNILRDFGAQTKLIWGTSSSPLLTDGNLIVNPGAPAASLVALDAKTGSVAWQTSGGEHAFASPIVATLGGVRQLVAFDRKSLGGFDPTTGTRLWTLTPPLEGDFNVPSPVVVKDQLLLSSENNGTRLYGFAPDGTVLDTPTTVNRKLAPDMCTPIVIGNRLFCISGKLYCLDLADSLRTIWIGRDPAIGDYAPMIASEDRLMVIGRGGEILLVDPQAEKLKIVSRLNPLADSTAGSDVTYAHPAVVGSKLYVRAGKTLICVNLLDSVE